MKIRLTEKGFTYTGENFNIQQICECGQMFRFFVNGKGNYCLFSSSCFAEVEQFSDRANVITSTPDYFINYFDLQTDYSEIIGRLNAFPILQQAIGFGKGIRIVKQELTETIVSFIISACNNIKRIQGIINRLCERLGEGTDAGYAFPSLKTLARQDESFFTNIGCGYRARYIVETCRTLHSTDILAKLQQMDTVTARKELMKLKGVGKKVADCVLLFGLNRKDVFPTDTWIKKVYRSYFQQGHKDNEIADYLVSLFGHDSGVAQQYLFYFQRNLTNV